jgi:hypothetical protein
MHGLSDEMVKKHILPEISLNNPRGFCFITGGFDILKSTLQKTLVTKNKQLI